jgi:hypothetical protein
MNKAQKVLSLLEMDNKEEIIKLYKAGKTLEEIGKEMNLTITYNGPEDEKEKHIMAGEFDVRAKESNK